VCKNAYWLKYRYHHPADSSQDKELDPLTGQPRNPEEKDKKQTDGTTATSGAGGPAAGAEQQQDPNAAASASNDNTSSAQQLALALRNADKKTVVLLIDGKYLLNPLALEAGRDSLKIGYGVANVPPYVWEDQVAPKYFLADVGFVIRGFDRFAAAPRVLPDVAPHSVKKLLGERSCVELLAYLGHVRKDRGREESTEVERELQRIRLFAGFGNQLDFNSFLLVYKLYCDAITTKWYRSFQTIFGRSMRQAALLQQKTMAAEGSALTGADGEQASSQPAADGAVATRQAGAADESSANQ
ncbi:unnamed protein product, partial [Amoebophrya sp. A120]